MYTISRQDVYPSYPSLLAYKMHIFKWKKRKSAEVMKNDNDNMIVDLVSSTNRRELIKYIWKNNN